MFATAVIILSSIKECELSMSQSSSVLKLSVLQTAVLLYEMSVFPHTASVSLTAGVHVLSQLLFFSEILLLWYCFTLVSFLFCFSISELSSENVRTCFQIINAYIYLSATDFLQVWVKTTSNKRKFKEDWNDCVNVTLFALSQKE